VNAGVGGDSDHVATEFIFRQVLRKMQYNRRNQLPDNKHSGCRCPGRCKCCKRENLCSEPFKYTYGDTNALRSDVMAKKKAVPKKTIAKKPADKAKPKPSKKRKASLLDKRVGNEFWKKRIKHGRDKIFSTPEMLWDCCLEYFKWVEANPLVEEKLFSFQGKVHKGEINRMRAMTTDGLCIFLGIGTSTWHDYSERDDYSAVITRAEQIMKTQKFAGAAADMLNPNIIARDLGLTDKKEVKHGLSVISMDDKDKDA